MKKKLRTTTSTSVSLVTKRSPPKIRRHGIVVIFVDLIDCYRLTHPTGINHSESLVAFTFPFANETSGIHIHKS